jgi:dipeptidyl aminopeptidase/acylaminoacyl peptidase
MMYRPAVLSVFVFTIAAAISVDAQEGPRFNTQLALDVRSPQIAAATDDARFIAVTLRTRRGRVDTDHGRYGDPTYVAPSLVGAMVIDTRTGDATWLHEDPAQVSDFTWSSDGSQLAYLVFEDARFSLRVFDADSGDVDEVELRTDLPIASSSPLVWAPDGRSILLTLRELGWAERASEAFYELTEAPVIVQDSRNDFLAWDRVRNIANEQVTALVSIEDGSVREILRDVVPQGVGFSPDGSRLTYSTSVRTKTSYTRRDGTDYGVYALEVGDSEPVALVEPSEDRIAAEWNAARDALAYARDGGVWVRRLDDDEAREVTESHRVLAGDTAKVDYSVDRWSADGSEIFLTSANGWHVLDADGGELQTVFQLEDDEDLRPRRSVLSWSDDGRYVYFSFSARTRWERGLKRLDVASGDVETVLLDSNLYSGWQLSEDGARAVYTMSDGDRPNDVWMIADDSDAPVRLTELNLQLGDVAVARTELVEYLDVDGNTLYGILYYPIDYDPTRKYPLVAEIYEQFFDNGFNENMNFITAQGWFGFRPSVQFEEGYPGEAWLKAVPNAINKLIDRGLVDEDQLGVYGQSYGGYATNLLITQTDRFVAAANVSGKVNMVSFLGDSPKITTRNYAAAEVGQDRLGATLWEQPQKYIDHSAVMFADRVETPLLMLSGEGDWNVPATNQREMYYALRRLEKEVVWVHYTAGGHGAGRASSVADFHDHWKRMIEWFAEHFEGGVATVSEDGQGTR